MNILVVAAHPDDEVLGCGGSMAKWAKAGNEVNIIIIAEGATSRDIDRDRNAREEELSNLAEMGVIAAKDAINNSNIDVDDIDAVIVACSNLERAYPAIAIEIQNALGIKGFAFDMNVACSAPVYVLSEK